MTIRQDLRIYQGETWSHTYVHRSAGSPVDLTGYSAAMSVKRVPGQTTMAQAYLSTGADADGGTITLGGANGEVVLSMTADETKALLTDVDIRALIPPEKRRRIHHEERFIYDLLLTDASGAVTRALEGQFIVRRSVTP